MTSTQTATRSAAPAQVATSTQVAPTENKVARPEDKKRLYVRWDFTDDMLKAFFAKYGSIAEAKVAGGRGAPRNFGFVTFESEDAAAKALNDMNNKAINTQHTLAIQYSAPAANRRERAPRAPREQKQQSTNQGQTNTNSTGRRTRAPRDNSNQRDGQQTQQRDGQQRDGQRQPRQRNNRRQGGQAQGQGQQQDGQQQRAPRQLDPNYGKVVKLIPDPIATPIPANAQLTTIVASERQFRKGRADGRTIQQLSLTADPSKGPFHCDFKLGAFDLKLLSVSVRTGNGGIRVSCRIEQVSTGKSQIAVLQRKSDGKFTHRFFSPRRAPVATEQKEQPFDAFFVAIDQLSVDPATGLWKNLLLSLNSLTITPRAQVAATATTAAPAPAAASTSSVAPRT
jgi:hypothetical protein